MKSSSHQNQTAYTKKPTAAVFTAALLVLAGTAPVHADLGANSLKTPKVIQPGATPYGKSYGEWEAAWNQWAFALPVENHPFTDSPNIDFSAGQSGPVWFLAGAGTTERAATIPSGKALFVALVSAECSSLELDPFHGDTAEQQAACAKFFADHIHGVFCVIDGHSVNGIQNYRVASPQYTFTAPTPWIFGDVGGTGTSVSDGYWVMLAPLSKGAHTLHFGGTFHFAVAEGDPFDADFGIDETYDLTIQ